MTVSPNPKGAPGPDRRFWVNPPPVEPAPTVRARRHVLRVLVTDDSELDRQLTVHWLGEIWPFEHELSIVVARNGEEALDRVLTMRLSFVILDWNLPQISGSDVLHRMRRYGVLLPVVVVSGLQRDEIRADLEAMGAAFVNKNEMDAVRLQHAIARSIELMQAAPRPMAAIMEKAAPRSTDVGHAL